MNSREIILEALLLYEKGIDFADTIIKGVFDKYSHLQKYEKSFLDRVFTGTVERMLTLDYIIDSFSTVKTNKQKPVIRSILRMSVYQLMFMDSVPDSAVINEAVKLAKKKKFTSLSGFVNAVLRKIAAKKNDIIYPDIADENYLPVKYSCPAWLCTHFVNESGMETAEKVLKNSLKIRPLIIRTNLSKISKEGLKQRLTKEGAVIRDIVPNDLSDTAVKCGVSLDAALIIEECDSLTELLSFKEGLFTVQDLSSQQVGLAIEKSLDVVRLSGQENHPDLLVLDVCASPGGKTCHIADILAAKGISSRIISRDISEDKLKRINENISRCGFKNVSVNVHDALICDENLTGKADIVIADLPCSGLGVISRKVDIKYRVKPDDLQALSKLQRDILAVVSQYVKPGGMLVYSTCTVNKSENENNVKWVCENMPFELCKPCVQFINDNEYTDGFFIALFRRKAQ